MVYAYMVSGGEAGSLRSAVQYQQYADLVSSNSKVSKRPSSRVKGLLSQVASSKSSKKKGSGGPAAITRRQYPALVELKIAGKTDKEIARAMGASVNQIKMHLSRAMAEYRRDELEINGGKAVGAAKEDAAEDSQQVLDSLENSGALSSEDAVSIKLSARLSAHTQFEIKPLGAGSEEVSSTPQVPDLPSATVEAGPVSAPALPTGGTVSIMA